jgi:CRP/FNR family transcriptional regulator
MSVTAASPHYPCETCEVRDRGICSALDDNELLQLNKITTEVKLGAGGTAFMEGDDSTYLFNVVSGAIRLSKSLPDGRRQITGFLFPGDFLGLSIADTYAYSAEAVTKCTLCRFARTNLTNMLEKFPNLEQRLLSLASNELAQAQDHLMILGQKTSTERLATLLLKFAERIGDQDDGSLQFDIPMNRTDIADYIGLTTETVSRTFSLLRKRGIIETPESRTIRIPKIEELAAVSGDQ